MVQSSAKTVAEYLKSLPADRRAAVEALRKVILKNLPSGCVETMQYGMIGYVVSLKRYPKGYLGDPSVPLPYAALASQKNYVAVYLMGLYSDPKLYDWFVSEYQKTGKKLDMGKSCVRFKRIEDVPLALIGKAIAKIPADQYIRIYEESHKR